MKVSRKILYALTLLSASIGYAAEAPPAKRAKIFYESPINTTQFSSLDYSSESQSINELEHVSSNTTDINWFENLSSDLLMSILHEVVNANPQVTAQSIIALAKTCRIFHSFINDPQVMKKILNALTTNQAKKQTFELLQQSHISRIGFLPVLQDVQLLEWFAQVTTSDANGRELFTRASNRQLNDVKTLIDEARVAGNPLDMNWRSDATTHYIPFDAHYIGRRTPLMAAADRGQTAMVQLLLNLGADIKLKDELGYTALDCAILRNHLPTAQLLLERGFDRANQDELLRITRRHNNPQMVELLLAAGVDPRAGLGSDKKSARQLALENGAINIVEILDEAKSVAQKKSQEKSAIKTLHPQPLLQGLPERITPQLTKCLEKKNPAKIATAFFAYALANPAFVADMQDPAYLKTFFKALPYKQNRIELAHYFMKATNNMFDLGKTPFVPGYTDYEVEELKDKFVYAFAHNKGLMRWIDKTKDHLVDARNLAKSVDNNNLDRMQDELQNRYLDLNSEVCMKALANAIVNGNKPSALALLKAGVNPNKLLSQNIYTSNCHPEMIQLLIDFGVDPRPILYYVANSEDVELSKLLIQAGGHIQNDGSTLLTQLIRNGYPKAAKTLLDAGVNLDAQNLHDKNTALDFLNRKKALSEEEKYIHKVLTNPHAPK